MAVASQELGWSRARRGATDLDELVTAEVPFCHQGIRDGFHHGDVLAHHVEGVSVKPLQIYFHRLGEGLIQREQLPDLLRCGAVQQPVAETERGMNQGE